MKNSLERKFGFFLAGAVLGGTAIALTTPLTGRRTRRLIGKQIDRGTKQAEEAARQLQETGRRACARGSQLLQQAGKAASQAVSFSR